MSESWREIPSLSWDTRTPQTGGKKPIRGTGTDPWQEIAWLCQQIVWIIIDSEIGGRWECWVSSFDAS